MGLGGGHPRSNCAQRFHFIYAMPCRRIVYIKVHCIGCLLKIYLAMLTCTIKQINNYLQCTEAVTVHSVQHWVAVEFHGQ